MLIRHLELGDLVNERVRVLLEYRDVPGDGTRPHYHLAFVLYALSAFERLWAAAVALWDSVRWDEDDELNPYRSKT